MKKTVALGIGAVVAFATFGCERNQGAGAGAVRTATNIPTTTGAEAIPNSGIPAEAPQLAADTDPIAEGTVAPDFTVQIQGKPVKLSSLRGHPVMLDFWATWCGPCVAGLPHTQTVSEKGKDSGLQVIAISDETNDIVSKFIKDNKYTFSVGLDEKRESFDAYKINAIPTTVVIDKAGKVVSYLVGGGQDDEIEKALAKAGVK